MIWCAGGGAQADLTQSSVRACPQCGGAGGVFAAPARAYHNGSNFGRKEAGAAVIDDTMAERMVACGWIAAAIAGALMIVFSLMVKFPFGLLYLGGAAILFALAYGIYRRSRVCAVIVLINHFLGVAGLIASARDVPSTEIAVALVLGVLYVLGVMGTFVHHSRHPAAA
jgi:hypothetical protein